MSQNELNERRTLIRDRAAIVAVFCFVLTMGTLGHPWFPILFGAFCIISALYAIALACPSLRRFITRRTSTEFRAARQIRRDRKKSRQAQRSHLEAATRGREPLLRRLGW